MKFSGLNLHRYWAILVAALIFVGLYLTSLYSYLLFHSLAEIFSIVIAFAIFLVAWNSRQFMKDDYLVFVGIAYLFVGFLDLMHTLGYKGMGVFPGYGSNLATQLWIAARYLQSFSLLIAPLFFTRKINIPLALAIFSTILVSILASIFYWGIFPDCYIEGLGLTAFKKTSEIFISLILFGSFVLLIRYRERLPRQVFLLISWSIWITIAAELAFVLYERIDGFPNFLGHVFKILSFYLIYKAIVQTGIREPYELLFRELVNERDALANEVTERKKVTEALAKSEAFLRDTGKMAKVGGWELDAITQEVRWTEETYRIHEVPLGEMPKLDEALSFFHPEDRPNLERVIQRAVDYGEPYDMELRFTTAKGKPLWTYIIGKPHQVDGKTVRLTGSFQDITAHKKAEAEIQALNKELEEKIVQINAALEQLRMQNELLQALQRAQTQFISNRSSEEVFEELLHDLLVLTQSEFGFFREVLYAEGSQPYARNRAITGITWDEKSQKKYEELANEKWLDFYNIRGLWGSVIHSGKPLISNNPDTDPRRSGVPKCHPVLHSFCGIPFLSEGKILGMVGMANRPGGYNDQLLEFLQPYVLACANIMKAYQIENMRIEAERRLEEAHADLEKKVLDRTAEIQMINEKLEKLVKELQLRNTELERFAYTVSHDLQAPLITIQSFVSIIQNDLASGNVERPLKDLKRVYKAAANMKALLQGVLELSRVGRILNPPELTPFKDVINHALSALEGPIARSSAEMVVMDNFPTILVDKLRMVQVIQNLVENALKFSGNQKPPYIEIGILHRDGEELFYVKDHGKGIKPEFRDRVFQLFCQLDPATSGTGLGLALVKKIIEHHNGRIWIESNVEEAGSTFLFSLPQTDS